MLSNSRVLHKAEGLSHGARKIEQVQHKEAREWFSFYKMSYEIWKSSPFTEPQISCAGVSLVHYSATENTPTGVGFVGFWCLFLFFYNLVFIFNQLDFSLSPSKEAEENPKHQFCDLWRWK